jgi:hypothetical protein
MPMNTQRRVPGDKNVRVARVASDKSVDAVVHSR